VETADSSPRGGGHRPLNVWRACPVLPRPIGTWGHVSSAASVALSHKRGVGKWGCAAFGLVALADVEAESRART